MRRRLIFALTAITLLFVAGQVSCKPIDLAEPVLIGGIQQWITVKGVDTKAPVLLFLHGGPGNSALSYAQDFTGELQKKFIVVQWDQRETGKTKRLNSYNGMLTVALFESDVVAMIEYLKKRFGKEKIFLMGHSWGGFLGLRIAARRPDLLEGCFAVSPMVWQEESERQTLSIMKERNKTELELRELNSISIPFASGHDLYVHRKGLAKLMGQRMYSETFVQSWAVKWLALFNEASRVNFFKTAPEIECPVYFILGGNDYQTYHKLSEEYFQMLKAPRKEIFIFPQSAHSFLSSQQKKLQEIIINQLPERPN